MMFHFKNQNFIDMYHCFFFLSSFTERNTSIFFLKCVATPVKKHICAIIKTYHYNFKKSTFNFGYDKCLCTFQDFLKIGVLDFSPHLIACTNIADLTRINLSVPQFKLVLFCQERMIL